MAAGLQIFDPSGNLILDTSHRCARVIGMVQLDGHSSSLYDSRMTTGGFVSFQPDSYIGYASGGLIHPQFSIVNGVLSWTYAAMNSTTYDKYVTGQCFYGAY